MKIYLVKYSGNHIYDKKIDGKIHLIYKEHKHNFMYSKSWCEKLITYLKCIHNSKYGI